MKIRDSKHFVQSSLKSYPLWVTLYHIKLNQTVEIFLEIFRSSFLQLQFTNYKSLATVSITYKQTTFILIFTRSELMKHKS